MYLFIFVPVVVIKVYLTLLEANVVAFVDVVVVVLVVNIVLVIVIVFNVVLRLILVADHSICSCGPYVCVSEGPEG